MATGLEKVSSELGLAPQHVYALVAMSENSYQDAYIPKASGNGTRTIKIPNRALKGVQKLILRQYLQKVSVHECAHAYVQGRGVVSAARKLCGPKAVLKIDIADFFPTISSARVLGLFRSLGFDNSAAHVLTRLTTLEGHLPQGAPTSPCISNIIFCSIDRCLKKLSSTWEMDYVRYSDDLFFVNNRNFNHPDFLAKANNIIAEGGFVLNSSKTRFYAKYVPRKTLGILTHGECLAIPGPDRRTMRSAFHKGSRNIAWGQQNANRLRGMIEWHKLIYGKDETYYQYASILNTIIRLRLHISYQST